MGRRKRVNRYLKISGIEMPDDGQYLHIFACFNSLPYCYSHGIASGMYKEQVNIKR